jgi:hypothetical protein
MRVFTNDFQLSRLYKVLMFIVECSSAIETLSLLGSGPRGPRLEGAVPSQHTPANWSRH